MNFSNLRQSIARKKVFSMIASREPVRWKERTFNSNLIQLRKVQKRSQKRKKMKIRRFCCCFSLEFGAFVIGIVRLIWASIDGFSKITGGFTLLFNECKISFLCKKKKLRKKIKKDLKSVQYVI